MAVLPLKSKDENIAIILYHLGHIWKDKDYEIRGFGRKFLGYGLKQSEFSDFENSGNPINERKFREYKNDLLEAKLIHEVYTKNKKSGRPFYQITPMGIAYLVQNFELETRDIRNCFDILTYYNKNEIIFKWKKDYEYYLIKACELVSGDSHSTIIESVIGDDLEADLRIGVEYILHRNDDMNDYRKASHHIIGNMCWFLLQFDTLQKNADTWAKSVSNTKFQSVRVSKELVKVGMKYGKAILKNVLQQETNRVQEILMQR